MEENPFEEIFGKKQSQIFYGLERVQKAFDHLGLQEKLSPSILVAGTNGKGSTSGFLAKLFEAQGYQVGIFTSPHLSEFRERIQCSHQEVTDELLLKELAFLKLSLGPELYGDLSFFEISTLLAFSLFARLKTQINIIEVGLGGRLDATNILEPIASVIVSIGFDHEKILGSSLDKIFREKLGVARPHKPLFIGMSQEERKRLGLEDVLLEYKQEQNFQLYSQGKEFSLEETGIRLNGEEGEDIQFFSFLLKKEETPPILRKNFSIAFSLFHWYLKSQSKTLNFSALQKNYRESSFFPPSLIARFQRFSLRLMDGSIQDVILDVCHNAESLRESYRSLKEFGFLQGEKKIPVFISILKDKPFSSMIDYVQNFADPVVLFSCSSERSLTKKIMEESSHKDKAFYEGFHEVWKSPYGQKRTDEPWLICGSFFALGEIFSFLKKNFLQSPSFDSAQAFNS